MRQIPTAAIPLAGLIFAATVVAPIEIHRTRTRLQRWARALGWQRLRGGEEAVALARGLLPEVTGGRVGPVLRGWFDGSDVIAVQVTGTRAGHRRNLARTAVAVRRPGMPPPVVGQPGAAVRDGWVVVDASAPLDVGIIRQLLPLAIRASRDCPRPVPTAA